MDLSWLTPQPQRKQDNTYKAKWKQINKKITIFTNFKKVCSLFVMWIYSFKKKITDY